MSTSSTSSETAVRGDAIAAPLPNASTPRLQSIDVFRGWVMFMMLAEMFHFCNVSSKLPDNPVWKAICFHWSHVPWRGMSLHDLIQPAFSFLVGTALAFSIESRRRRGQSARGLIAHAVWRSMVLVLLGVFLRSLHKPQTYWTFEDTLSQIGLGYLPLVLIALAPRIITWLAIAIILLGYWLVFAAFQLPAEGFDYAAVNALTAEEALPLDRFAAHWNKNSNFAWWFDTWFLNLFTRESAFEFNRGGYSTLSFIPTLATMLLGLVAGRWLRQGSSNKQVLTKFAAAALIGIAAGIVLDVTDICPNVKRIWTPSWVLYSGGWCFLTLGVLHAICDIAGYRRWSYFFAVFGVNSIVAYTMEWFMPEFIQSNMTIHFGGSWARSIVGEIYEPLLVGCVGMAIIWSILWYMHRQRIYIKL